LFHFVAFPPSIKILNVSILKKQASPWSTLSWWISIICPCEIEKKRKRRIKTPLTFILSCRGRGKKEDERILTAPLTFVLSRKGREEMREIPARWRGSKRKNFN